MNPIQAFWSKVDKVTNPNGCWEWQGPLRPKGLRYGQTTWKGKTRGAHHVAWELANGRKLPKQWRDKKWVLRHTCDNPSCCNPKHLIFGTHEENSADMIERGRNQRGEEHVNSKMKVSDVLRICSLYYDERWSVARIRNHHYPGVTETCIRSILKGRSWSHITGIGRDFAEEAPEEEVDDE